MLPLLSRETASSPLRHPERIVQFGGGNFLRGFVDWVVDILNDEAGFGSGVVLVKTTPGRYDALDAQDCLFTTHLQGLRAGQPVDETRLITAINRTVYPYEDYEACLSLARQPDIRFIFSNTTESGIVYSQDDRLDDWPPATFPAKLARFLYERYRHFDGAADRGCIVIPTELIVDNATRLRGMILDYARLWHLEPGFAAWIQASNLFCNTLVDRIIPGYPHAQAERVFAELGYRDCLLVAGELYHSWIIEGPERLLDEFPVQRTRTPLNVKIVRDAAPYRTIKVRLLNGAHTAMAPLGHLLGIETVREAVEDERLGGFIQAIVFDEIIPSVTEIPREELEAFAHDMFDRFCNPHIDHHLLTISLNTSAKARERLLPTLLGYFAATGKWPARTVLAIAAFIRLYKGEWQGETIPLKDDPQLLEWFRQQWANAESIEALVAAVLGKEALWKSNLNELPGLADALAKDLRDIDAGRLRERL